MPCQKRVCARYKPGGKGCAKYRRRSMYKKRTWKTCRTGKDGKKRCTTAHRQMRSCRVRPASVRRKARLARAEKMTIPGLKQLDDLIESLFKEEGK